MISILTGKNTARILSVHGAIDISDMWRKSMGIDVGDIFRSIECISYCECTETGFRYYQPSLAAGGGELYEQLEKYDWYYMPNKWEFGKALNLLAYESKILEVGVGEGHFLSAARLAGHDVQGVELNPLGADRARSKGFVIHEEMLDRIHLDPNDKFDSICSFQVLEHVAQPLEFLRGMLKLLKPNGKLILSVPNAAVQKRIDPLNLGLLNQPPHHMGHWDESVFRSLEKFLPVKLTSVHIEPLASYHVAWMVSGYLRGKFSFLGSFCSRLLFNRITTLPVQLILLSGLRKFLPGHTLLVEFEYFPAL